MAAVSAPEQAEAALAALRVSDEMQFIGCLEAGLVSSWHLPELRTMLQECARLGFVDALQALHRRAGSKINREMASQALLYAASYQKEGSIREVVSWTLPQYASCSDGVGKSVAEYAAKSSADIFELLWTQDGIRGMNIRSDSYDAVVRTACMAGNVDVLQRAASFTGQFAFPRPFGGSYSVLHFIRITPHCNVIRFMLKGGHISPGDPLLPDTMRAAVAAECLWTPGHGGKRAFEAELLMDEHPSIAASVQLKADALVEYKFDIVRHACRTGHMGVLRRVLERQPLYTEGQLEVALPQYALEVAAGNCQAEVVEYLLALQGPLAVSQEGLQRAFHAAVCRMYLPHYTYVPHNEDGPRIWDDLPPERQARLRSVAPDVCEHVIVEQKAQALQARCDLVKRLLREPVNLQWKKHASLRVAIRQGILPMARLLLRETLRRHPNTVLPMGVRGLFLPLARGYNSTSCYWRAVPSADEDEILRELLALTGRNTVPEQQWRNARADSTDEEGDGGVEGGAQGHTHGIEVQLRRDAGWMGGCVRGGRRVAVLARVARQRSRRGHK